MSILLGLLVNVFQDGLTYGIMAIGVYVTYQVLNFPDLSVDGTFPLGACVTAVLIVSGVNPWLACLAAFLSGAAAGGVTGLLNVKLHITDLLSGILVMTALWSVNLVVVGGNAVLPFYNKPTIFTSGPAALLPPALHDWRVLIVAAVCCIVVKLAVDLYLKTKSGLLLRASGDNPQYVVSLGRDPGNMKILGLMIGNGCTALAGSVFCQQAESADIYSGPGKVVMALASVIIGVHLFARIKFVRATFAVILGSVVYEACLVAAMQLGLPMNYMKLLMAAIFTVALVSNHLTALTGRRKKQNAGPEKV